MSAEAFTTKPLPPANAESKPYWDACAEGRLLVQRCRDCAAYQFYPRLLCTACGARTVEWVQASGAASVRTFTVIRRAVSAAFEADVPYVVALVALAEGPTLMTNIVDCAADHVHIGMQVQVTFEARGNTAVPVFRPA